MNLIVSDNSPLSLLIRIGQLGILPQLYSAVVIPDEVARELNDRNGPESVRDFLRIPPPWIRIQKPIRLLSIPSLDAGELAAISLAEELNAVLLIDEKVGRAAARARSLTIVGVVGILELAANRNLINDLAKVHAEMRSFHFFVSDQLLAASLARHLSFKKARQNP